MILKPQKGKLGLALMALEFGGQIQAFSGFWMGMKIPFLSARPSWEQGFWASGPSPALVTQGCMGYPTGEVSMLLPSLGSCPFINSSCPSQG